MKKTASKKSSGNVFRDLGFKSGEAENLQLRARLMAEIEKYIRSEKITQFQAAKRFGVTQPRISDLVRGKIHLFSVDTLISMLTHAGLSVTVQVKKTHAA
jgi:predicted XRE-type DNA-binding protein